MAIKPFLLQVWVFMTTTVGLMVENFFKSMLHDTRNPKVWEEFGWTMVGVFGFVGLMTRNPLWNRYIVISLFFVVVMNIMKRWKNDVGQWKAKVKQYGNIPIDDREKK